MSYTHTIEKLFDKHPSYENNYILNDALTADELRHFGIDDPGLASERNLFLTSSKYLDFGEITDGQHYYNAIQPSDLARHALLSPIHNFNPFRALPRSLRRLPHILGNREHKDSNRKLEDRLHKHG